MVECRPIMLSALVALQLVSLLVRGFQLGPERRETAAHGLCALRSLLPQITIEKIIIQPTPVADKKPKLEVNNQQQAEILTALKVIRYQPIPIGPPGPAGN